MSAIGAAPLRGLNEVVAENDANPKPGQLLPSVFLQQPIAAFAG